MVDEHTLVVLNKDIDPDLLFALGQATAIIVEPKSADTNATKPVGTGPYQLGAWNKGSSVVLTAWDGFRAASTIKLRRATFRFISDPAAQVAALLAGDVDLFPASRPQRAAVQDQPALSGAGQWLARQDHPGHQQRQKAAGRCARAPRHRSRH